jgi:hypothetical protein
VGRWLVALLACGSLGCADAIFSVVSFRGHDAFDDEAFRQFEADRARGVVGKPQVLAVLGPPTDVLRQDAGEIFLYRRVARDLSVLNLDPSMLPVLGTLPPVPLFFRRELSGREDTLMVFFDAQGRVGGHAARFAIHDTEQSTAARIGEGVRGVLP